MTDKKTYDWIVVGGGISGISIAEILCRSGKRVLLVEKNKKLASETSKVFHEWLHSGSLYSLTPDKLLTLRYLLGSTDDLFEYYDSFSRMNLVPTNRGVSVNGKGWFNSNNVEYRYRLHKFNPVWSSLVSRSINIIELIHNHDWLRKRAGSEYGRSKVKFSFWFDKIISQMSCNADFFSINSPDITINSRNLISDILSSAVSNGLSVATDEKVLSIEDKKDFAVVNTNKNTYSSSNVVVCSPDLISNIFKIPIKIGYAPIAVVENVPIEENSFVELDYNTKKCINLIKKDDGIAQAGGITMDKKEDVEPYLNYIISEHKNRNPGINVVGSYIGIKKELTQKGENRNYLYHINQNSSRLWSVVLGKFSLAFSMAPEFYRQVYKKNPPKVTPNFKSNAPHNFIDDTSWQEIINNSRSKKWE